MSEAPPLIWAILGEKRGDNNQVLALAEALHLPFEVRDLRYNALRKLPKALRGPSVASLEPRSRKTLQPPWPELVIAVGHRSVPIVRWIHRQSGNRTRLVHIGNPQVDPSRFDLVVTTPQYDVPDAPNVLRLALPITGSAEKLENSEEEEAWLDGLPRPHRLMLVGGPTKMWAVTPGIAANGARSLVERSNEDGGTVIAVGSPRTEDQVCKAIERVLGQRHRFVRGRMPRYRVLLQDADEIYVTADSISMIADASGTGRPVGIIPIERSAFGRVRLWAADRGLARRPPRDLRKAWHAFKKEGLVGTIDNPVASVIADPVDRAARAVLGLLSR